MRQHRRPSRSLLLLAIRYTEQRANGMFYYQRAVPSDLRDRLPTKIIKVPLGTADPVIALRKVKLLNSKHERQWDLLRADSNASAEAAETQASGPSLSTRQTEGGRQAPRAGILMNCGRCSQSTSWRRSLSFQSPSRSRR